MQIYRLLRHFNIFVVYLDIYVYANAQLNWADRLYHAAKHAFAAR